MHCSEILPCRCGFLRTGKSSRHRDTERAVDRSPAFYQLKRTVCLSFQENLFIAYHQHIHFLKAGPDTGPKVLIHGKFCDSLSKNNLMGVSRLVTHINLTGPEKNHYSQRSYCDKALQQKALLDAQIKSKLAFILIFTYYIKRKYSLAVKQHFSS